jgi:hypothetical protein
MAAMQTEAHKMSRLTGSVRQKVLNAAAPQQEFPSILTTHRFCIKTLNFFSFVLFAEHVKPLLVENL